MAQQQFHDEEVLGKAYDNRLMRRLLTYLRPYKFRVLLVLGAILLKACADITGPYLTKVAVDKYLAYTVREHSWLDRWLSPHPLTGIAQISLLYVGTLIINFFLEFTQTYFMQWTGQKVMFDLRSQIFRRLQHMHIGFYDKNPVGRLVTRVTSDVDALNEMFTSGVVSIFEDVFVLLGIVVIMLRMDWRLALITFAVLPLIVLATVILPQAVRDSYRRIRAAIAVSTPTCRSTSAAWSVVQLFNREKRAHEDFRRSTAPTWRPSRTPSLAYALYYPAVEILSAGAMAMVIWFGGGQVFAARDHIGRAGGVHAIRAAVLPSHPGSEREVQHSAVGHGFLASAFSSCWTPRSRSPRRPRRKRPAAPDASNSTTSGSPMEMPEDRSLPQVRQSRLRNPTGCCATSASPSNPARRWPSWATPAPARRP